MEPAETFVEDFLEHHGVKGMKWGVRKDRSLRKEQKAQKKADRKKRNEDIVRARARVVAREQRLSSAVLDASYATNPRIKKLADDLVAKYSKESVSKAAKQDSETANRLTTGEKWTQGVLLSVGGVLVASGIYSQIRG